MLKRYNSKSPSYLKITLLILFFSLILFISQTQTTKSAQDCSSLELTGYAYSENIGFISFNCSNNDTCATVNYKVVIDGATGKFTGFAWSENIGWINFGPEGPYPGPPGQEVKLSTGSGKVTGWARACAVFASDCSGALKSDSARGGWDGWIRTADGSYDITLNDSTDEFEGWAWGGDIIGWISFNCLNEGTCAVSDYKVESSFSVIPSSPTALQTNTKAGYQTNAYNVQDPCDGLTVCSVTPIPKFQWTPDGVQEEYQLQVDDNSDFSSLLWDSGWVVTDISTDIVYAGSAMAWDAEYFWRVKTISCFNESNWSNPAKFYTNRYPIADFTVGYGFQGEDVLYTFTSTSIEPDHEEPSGYSEISNVNGSIITTEWDLDDNGTYEETGTTVQKILPTSGAAVIKLRITDDGGLQDIYAESVNLEFLPQLKAESGDVYSQKTIKGKNINFNAAYLIHAGGQISNVSQENFSDYGDISFPSGNDEFINDLGKIDWAGLVYCGGNPCINQYGYVVETITNPNQIDNPLAGKIYYRNGDLRLNSNDIEFDNATVQKSGAGLILVDGDLIIEKNITYSNNPNISDLKKMASVGWIIKGDLLIDASVQNLSGAFVALGADGVTDCAMTQISADPLRYSTPEHCGLVKTGSAVPASDDVRLIIKGLLFSRRLFFQRAVKSITADDYAEKVIYDYHTFLNPPPGMEDFIKGLPTWEKVAP